MSTDTSTKNTASAAWPELLRRQLDLAERVLRQGDRQKASHELALAAELLFLQAKKSKNIDEKQSLVKRATEILQTSVRLRGDDAPDDAAGKMVPPRRETTQKSDEKSAAASGTPAKTITLSDVAGLADVKETLSLRVIYPLRHPEKLKLYGISGGGGMLLFGPPGTGKTLLVRAVAGELGLPFYVIKSSEILSQYYGQSEKQLADLFAEARRQPEGAIVFLDEIDAIGAKRTENVNEASRRVLTQLLQELDGVDGRSGKLVFFAATNEPWLLDSALLRPPRFCEKCYVPLPDAAARKVLFQLSLRDCPVDEQLSLDDLVAQTGNFSGADIVNVCERAKLIPFRESIQTSQDRSLILQDFVRALEDMKPSVTEANLRRYEEWNAL